MCAKFGAFTQKCTIGPILGTICRRTITWVLPNGLTWKCDRGKE